MNKYLLFDLDGTLSDSGPGVTRSAQYALEKFGIHVEDPNDLICFLGPPLKNSFMEFYGFSEEQAVKLHTPASATALTQAKLRYFFISILNNWLLKNLVVKLFMFVFNYQLSIINYQFLTAPGFPSHRHCRWQPHGGSIPKPPLSVRRDRGPRPGDSKPARRALRWSAAPAPCGGSRCSRCAAVRWPD